MSHGANYFLPINRQATYYRSDFCLVNLILRKIPSPDILIESWCHLFSCGQIYSELEASHSPFILLRRLRMDGTFSRLHPLNVTRSETTKVVHMVPVLHVTIKHIGNRFKSAVRMRLKASDLISYVKLPNSSSIRKGSKRSRSRPSNAVFEPHFSTINR